MTTDKSDAETNKVFVLLEDNLKFRQLVENEGRQYDDIQVHTTASPDELKKVVRETSSAGEKFGLAFIDLDINGNGDVGLAVLREIRPYLNSKIWAVIVSRSGDNKVICNCYGLGAHSFLKKPLGDEEDPLLVQNMFAMFGQFVRPCFQGNNGGDNASAAADSTA